MQLQRRRRKPHVGRTGLPCRQRCDPRRAITRAWRRWKHAEGRAPLHAPQRGPGPVDTGNNDAPRACSGPLASGFAVLCVGGSVGTESPGLQAAIGAAKDGDVIQVAGGTYNGDISIQNKALTLLGGFDSKFAARAIGANETKLKGTGAGSVVQIVASGKTNTLDGFTITGGTGNSQVGYSGAGIYVVNGAASSSVHVIGNFIEGNVSGRGAGIASSGMGLVVIRSNVVRDNRAYSDHGGGLFINSRSADINGNTIEGNTIGPLQNPYGYGGGLYIFEPGTVARLSYNVVTNNTAVTVGSGVFIDNGAQASLDHELIYGNTCTEAGGSAITVDSTDESDLSRVKGSIVTITKSTVTGHNCPTQNHGDGILIGGYKSRATVTGSIFVDNGPTQFNYGRSADVALDVSSSFTTGDPKFVQPASHDFTCKRRVRRWGWGRCRTHLRTGR